MQYGDTVTIYGRPLSEEEPMGSMRVLTIHDTGAIHDGRRVLRVGGRIPGEPLAKYTVLEPVADAR